MISFLTSLNTLAIGKILESALTLGLEKIRQIGLGRKIRGDGEKKGQKVGEKWWEREKREKVNENKR